MLKSFRDKIAVSGITILITGIALLVFTFASAYGFLTQSLNIMASQDLVRTFGEALAPMIATCIRIMYLGVMGWTGSLITIRGVTMIANVPKADMIAIPQESTTKSEQQPKTEVLQEPKPPEIKTPEPEFIVLPPEQVAQPNPQPETNQTQKSDSPNS